MVRRRPERGHSEGRGRAGLVEISQEARNILRMEAAIPWYGQDMDEYRYPMEARLETAISLTKGCYLGQEVVSKATHTGGGEPPSDEAEDQRVGSTGQRCQGPR